MRMPGQHHVEAGMGGLPVDLGRVRQQHGQLALGNIGRRLLDIVDAKEMGIVDAGQDGFATGRG